MAKKKNGKWMQKVSKTMKKGAFSAKAKKAGMSTNRYASKKKGAKGRLGKQARLAQAFAKARKKKRK